ncbi:unnamed protein product [Musa hybrid cultivar]
MEGSSSGEELVVVKTRKPYTITKQRERWTEEHSRFLEALKLYGRAWQRIEGFMTMAYHRSAGVRTQMLVVKRATNGVLCESRRLCSKNTRFYHEVTMLTRQCLFTNIQKSISPGQEHDLDIPHPRPKSKSNDGFPRNGKPLKSISPSTNKVMDIKGDALQEVNTSSMAASLWPSAEAETSLRSTAEFLAGEIPGRHMNPTPSLEAIAAVTVAVAAAWWAAQGLLPCSLLLLVLHLLL